MYGRQPKTALDGYEPIDYERHAKDYAKAVNSRGKWYDEYLVEDHGDGTVTLLPNDAIPYPGRQIWRRINIHM
jgi:hypothetical protein